MIYPQRKQQRDQQAKQAVTQVADIAGMAAGVPGAGAILGAVDGISGTLTKNNDGTYKSGFAEFMDRKFNPLGNVSTAMDFLETGNFNDYAAAMTFGLAGGQTTAERKMKEAKKAESFAAAKASQESGRSFYGQMPQHKPTLYANGGKLGQAKGNADEKNATRQWLLDNRMIGDSPEHAEARNGFYREALRGYQFAPLGKDSYSYGQIYDYLQDAKNRKAFESEYAHAMKESKMSSADDYLQRVFDMGKTRLWEQAKSMPDKNVLDPAALDYVSKLQQGRGLNAELNKSEMEKRVDAYNEKQAQKNKLTTKPGSMAEALVENEKVNPLRRMSFARGGSILLGGKSHARGGNPIVDTQTGQVVAETEKGELLYDSKASKSIEQGVQFIQQHGKQKTPVEGGERIYSKKDTKKIFSLVRKKNFEKLGKHVYEATLAQDKRPPEFKA